MFSIKITKYQDKHMLNICDASLLGRDLKEGSLTVPIKTSQYGQRLVGRSEAATLLKTSPIINMAGSDTLSLSASLSIGSRKGARVIDGVPFLIVFQM